MRSQKRKIQRLMVFWEILTSLLIISDIYFQNYFRLLGKGELNTGISFGLMPGIGQGVGIIFFVFLIGALLFLWVKLRRFELFMISMGGLGNLIPRIFWGGVWDYLRIPGTGIWNNLSDYLIFIGVISYILSPNGNSDNI